ncbi:hypothetical protein CYJ38_10445 [Bifidobacterium breve]|nr:hypothetical protein CYJ38_10445 [Bifidobacterium breve]
MCVCWPAWRTGALPAIPPGGPGTRAWYWARSPRSASPPTEVEVFHTDRGGGFGNARIDGLLDVFDIGGSPSRKGDPYDNAVVESTNRLLKKELIYRDHHTGLEQPRSDLNDYVRWSDDQRLHSTPGYRSPNEFTQQGLVL